MKGYWREVYGCHHCGAISRYRHEIDPCWNCGESNERVYDGSDKYTIRDVTYTLTHRLMLWLTGHPQPEYGLVEWKDGRMPLKETSNG